MPIHFSLYLDAVRFIAAIAVFLDHISSYPFTKNIFWPPVGGYGGIGVGSYGGIAVTIFFVLSGYVIAYVVSTRENTLFKYASARISRIYSVVLIALLLTVVLDNIGLIFNPDFYSIQKIMWEPQSFEGYLSSLLFVNEYQVFNFNGIAPGTNGPYWSLSFEVTYYVIAGLFLFIRKWVALPIILILLILAGKTIAVLMPLWVLGYVMYFIRIKTIHRYAFYTLFVLSLASLLITPMLANRLGGESFGLFFPWGRGPFNRDLTEDYLAALFFAVNIICAREVLKDIDIEPREKLVSFIRWLGKLTFPLYLVHFPALAFLAAVSPWSNETISNTLFITLITFVLVIGVTSISDRFKNVLKGALLRLRSLWLSKDNKTSFKR